MPINAHLLEDDNQVILATNQQMKNLNFMIKIIFLKSKW